MTNKSPAPIDSAKVEDTGEPYAWTTDHDSISRFTRNKDVADGWKRKTKSPMNVVELFAAPPASPAASVLTDAGTPAATWRVNGEPDPHGAQYDCERAALMLGNLTDDELANGMFMNADQPMDIARMLARDRAYHPPIVWLTAAKERIRWLSRSLLAASMGGEKS